MTLLEIETELKKVEKLPEWGRRQNNEWDKATGFVYTLPKYDALLAQLKKLNKPQEFNDYAIRRWFNTWSACGVEMIFCSNPNVKAHTDKYNKLIDFSINGISFDHKTSTFPKNFKHDIVFANQHPEELIKWFYREQSKEGRFHTANRLFLVLYKIGGAHWELRKELLWLQPIINHYVAEFSEAYLYKLNLEPDKTTYSDIIWAIA